MTTTFGEFGASRRRVIKGFSAVAVASISSPAILRAQPASIVVATTGGKTEEALVKAVFEPWSKKTGIRVVSTSAVYAKVKSMVEAGAVEWDVFVADAAIAASFGGQKLLEDLDYGVIDKSAFIDGQARQHFLPNDVAAAVIGWNTSLVKTAPKSWAEVWSAEGVKGQRGLWRQPFQTMEMALMADGVDKDKLYPLDIDRAIASLEKLRSRLYWWTTGAQSTQILIDGEVPIAMGWNGRLFDPRADGKPVDFTFDQSLYVANAWAVPRGARNKKTSMEFIAFAMQAEQQAAYAGLIPYGPINSSALALMPEARLKDVPSSAQNINRGTFQNYEWWAENGPKASEKFNAFLLK